jgi:hypothetical protein
MYHFMLLRRFQGYAPYYQSEKTPNTFNACRCVFIADNHYDLYLSLAFLCLFKESYNHPMKLIISFIFMCVPMVSTAQVCKITIQQFVDLELKHNESPQLSRVLNDFNLKKKGVARKSS